MSAVNSQNDNNKASAESKSVPETKSSPESQDAKESWGYDLYPERRGTFKAKLSNILIGKEGKENIEKYKCEKNVYECVKNSKFCI